MPKRRRSQVPETTRNIDDEGANNINKSPKSVRKEKSKRRKKSVSRDVTVKNNLSDNENRYTAVLESKQSSKRAGKSKTVVKMKDESLSSAGESDVDDCTKQRKSPRKKATKITRNLENSGDSDSSNTLLADGDESKKSDTKKPKGKKEKESRIFLNQTSSDLNLINFHCDKLNGEGKKSNLKISSWNVAGLRAVIKKNGIDYIIKEDADIVVLQETKCDKNKLPNEIKIPGYQYYFLDSKRSAYCGMALYTKEVPISVCFGLSNKEFDDEGRLITAEYPNYYLVTVYVPNAGPKLITLPKRLKWNIHFKAYIKELDAKKPVIICGDMNVAHKDIDLKNPMSNRKNAGFTKEERDGMTDFLNQGFVDTYRYLYPNQTDAYTFWSYFANARSKNIGWRLDYFIVSERMKDKVCDVIIRSEVFGSDHCPIVMFANI